MWVSVFYIFPIIRCQALALSLSLSLSLSAHCRLPGNILKQKIILIKTNEIRIASWRECVSSCLGHILTKSSNSVKSEVREVGTRGSHYLKLESLSVVPGDGDLCCAAIWEIHLYNNLSLAWPGPDTDCSLDLWFNAELELDDYQAAEDQGGVRADWDIWINYTVPGCDSKHYKYLYCCASHHHTITVRAQDR